MKKLQIYLLVVLATLFAGCETEGEFRDMSYYNPEVTFNPIELNQQYRVTYNGSESPYISKSEKTFKLEVFKKDDATNTPVLTENECPSDKGITLIQPIEKELAVYTAETYISYTPTFSDITGYNVLFKTYAITPNAANYIPVSELPGDMTIVSEADPETVLFTMPLTAESNGAKPYIMKLSDTEFLTVPESDEPDPESGYCKVRFLYTQDAFPDYPELTLVVYLATTNYNKFSDPIATITLKAGEISEYVTVDNNFFGTGKVGGVFDLIDPNNADNYIVNNEKHGKTSFQFEKCVDNKFMVFRFTDSSHTGGNNVKTKPIDALCTPWK